MRRLPAPLRRYLVPLIVGLAAVVMVVVFLGRDSEPAPESLELSTFESLVAEGEVERAEIRANDARVVGELTDGTRFEVTYPADYAEALTSILLAADVEVDVDNQREPLWQRMLYELVPIILLLGALVWVLFALQRGKGMGMGRSRARRHRDDEPSVTFDDVAGCPEAIEELREITEFLAEPERFTRMGATIPKGVLLYGPPGTGKTLLARAVAGEAGVPFFSISGSDFVEMFVGVGASRVRGLFDQAKESAPSIVFVDEIDAVGRHRGSGTGGGHDEREQTLNQLLVEMDGFDLASGVILIAATNRPDILDPALLRPGRFDRQIVVDRPDLVGRRAILEVHSRSKPLADEVDLDVIAQRTAGFTGADLSNLLNEAALLATRRGEDQIGRRALADATDRVIAGPERHSRVMSEREKRIVAYHEAGHALVGHVLPNTDGIHKVSIVARGRALGWTLSLPTEDRHITSQAELSDRLAMLLGGRTAELVIFGDRTTGAADDLERATEMARAMVTQYGMSDVVGPQRVSTDGPEATAADGSSAARPSEHLAELVDGEVRRILEAAHAEATEILQLHRATLDRLAEDLVTYETLEEDALAELLGAPDSWDGGAVRAASAASSTAVVSSPGASAEPLAPTRFEHDERSGAHRPSLGDPSFEEQL